MAEQEMPVSDSEEDRQAAIKAQRQENMRKARAAKKGAKEEREFTVTPVDPVAGDDTRWYWCGLLPDCPVETATVAGVLFARAQEWGDPDNPESMDSPTMYGFERPGAYARISDSAIDRLMEAMTRQGLRVHRENGVVIRAQQAPIMTPGNDKRPARYNHGLEPLAQWAYIQPAELDSEGKPIFAERGVKLPSPMYVKETA